MLKSKLRDASQEQALPEHMQQLVTLIMQGGYEVLSLVQDQHEFYEPLVKDLREKNEELTNACEASQRKIDHLQKNYEQVLKSLTLLEFEQIDSQSEQRRILCET